VAALVAVGLSAAIAAPAGARQSSGRAHVAPLGGGCLRYSDPQTIEPASDLLRDNQVMADLGQRPTGSPAQMRFVEWLEQSMDRIPGIRLGAIPYKIDRWIEQGAGLAAGGPGQALTTVPISGAVPYAKPTSDTGVTGKLAYIPVGTAVAGQDIAGKVVVRDALPGTVPYAAFRAVSWFEWDPKGTLLKEAAGNYERDFAGYNQRLTDLADAASGKAAAIVFTHGFPLAQVKDHYAPYDGERFKLPALYVGADEGQTLKNLATTGGTGRVTLQAGGAMTPTRTVVATLPGVSRERIVIESHTDGMNAVWDNGPIAILALARHFAAIPRRCRPRTLQFVFTTAHLYQRLTGGADRGGSSEQVAKQLDADYDNGSLAMVFALEHLGAREYAAVARPAGLPGRELKPTGRNELNTIFVGESPLLVKNVIQAVVHHDLRRSFVMRGSDAPGATIPPHNSFGGEGTAYQQHLIPTVALVTGPWTLYNPSFGMEAVDIDLMRRQTVLFTDLIHRVFATPTVLLGGGYVAERAARAQVCTSSFATLGLTRCPGSPYG
jgi:hypothetical protein